MRAGESSRASGRQSDTYGPVLPIGLLGGEAEHDGGAAVAARDGWGVSSRTASTNAVISAR